MKKTKRNYTIIALIILLLSLSIGYAILKDQLTITGTANAKGTFDLVFDNPIVIDNTYSNSNLHPVGASNATISETSDDTLSVGVELAYPGAGQAFKVNIKNNSNVAAKCTNLTFTGGDEDVSIYYPIAANGLDKNTTIAAGSSYELIFYVKWDSNSTYSDTNGKEVSFSATFDYEQDIDNFIGDDTNYKTR